MRAGHHKDTYRLPGYLTKTDYLAGYDRKDTKSPDDFSSTEDNFIDLEPKITLDDGISLFLGGSYRNRHTSFHYETTYGPWDSMRRVETFSLTPKIVVKKDIFSLKNSLVAGVDYPPEVMIRDLIHRPLPASGKRSMVFISTTSFSRSNRFVSVPVTE